MTERNENIRGFLEILGIEQEIWMEDEKKTLERCLNLRRDCEESLNNTINSAIRLRKGRIFYSSDSKLSIKSCW